MCSDGRDLASVDSAQLSQDQRLTLLGEVEREIASLQAAKMRVLHTLSADSGAAPAAELDRQWIREEIACLLRVPAVTAASQIATAAELADRLPATLRALADGHVTLRQAERLVDSVAALPDDAVTKVEHEVLPNAAHQSTTQFAASVRRAVAKVDPRSMSQRHADGREQRRIAFTPQYDAMTELWAILPSDQAAAVRSRVSELATEWQTSDEHDRVERTADQRRADAFVALVLGGDGGAVAGTTAGGSAGAPLRPLVRVTVALSTLLGVDDQPADLDGVGPIPAALARRLADDRSGVWRRLVTDECGTVIDAAKTYRPPARTAGVVRANWRSCCFPGCRRPAIDCELDHIVAWADGGATSVRNLQPLCARHHHAKHEGGWHVRRLPDGTTRWTSPHGRTFDRPPDDPLPADNTMAQPKTPDWPDREADAA